MDEQLQPLPICVVCREVVTPDNGSQLSVGGRPVPFTVHSGECLERARSGVADKVKQLGQTAFAALEQRSPTLAGLLKTSAKAIQAVAAEDEKKD